MRPALLVLSVFLAAAAPEAALTDEEVVRSAFEMLGQERADEALETHGARLEALASSDWNAARALAFLKMKVGLPREAFEVARSLKARSPNEGLWVEADLTWDAGAFPLAIAKYKELRKKAPKAEAIADQLERISDAGFDSWSLEADAGSEGVLLYKHTGSKSADPGMPVLLAVRKSGDAIESVIEVVRLSSGSAEGGIDYDALLKDQRGIISSIDLKEGASSKPTFVEEYKVGGRQFSIAHARGGVPDAKTVARTAVEDRDRLSAVADGLRAAYAASRKKDAASLGAAILKISKEAAPEWDGIHFLLAHLLMRLEALAPRTAAGYSALRQAGERLEKARAAGGESPGLIAQEASLYWRIGAYGLCSERVEALRKGSADDAEAKEIGILLAATGHERWEKRDHVAVEGAPESLKAVLFKNATGKKTEPGVIVDELELVVRDGERLVGVVALSSQRVSGKTIHFFDVLAWGQRDTARVYGAARPSDEEFLKEAAAYLKGAGK